MPDTSFLVNDSKTVKLWDERLRRDALKSLFFTKFMGEGSDSIIQTNTDLVKGKGDTITFSIRMRSTSEGQTSSTTGITLEGNEEAMTFYSDSVALSEYGNATKVESELTEQRVNFNVRSEAKAFLQDWMTEKIEKVVATNLVTSPSTNRYVDESSAKITLASLRKLRVLAKTVTPTIRPVKIDGKEYYVFLTHPYVMSDLKADTNFINSQKDARERGIDNPLIKGADFIVDGILIYEYPRDELLQSGLVGRSLLLGAQAGYLAWSKKPSWHEKLHDYNTKYGAAVKAIMGVTKVTFNSEDYGVFALDNLYTDLTA